MKTYKKIIDFFKSKPVLSKIAEMVLSGVIFAICASLLTTYILSGQEKRSKINEQLRNISNIYIGCNKEWADEKFGTPQFTGNSDGYNICAYISDFYVLQFAFDENNSARAYLITALENDKNTKIEIAEKTLREKFVLGDFSYYDFVGSPMSVEGFVSNGSARMMYSELYYFNGGGAYYEYYLASLDFGIGVDKLKIELLNENEDVDDEVTAEKNKGAQIVTNRKQAKPNSFGVADKTDTMKLLLDYSQFNSQQLRNDYAIDRNIGA